MENSGQVFDVIVIGAGVMGSSTAYHTAKRGLTTLLLEQFDFLHYRGSSHGESRTIRATYPEDYYSGMALESSRLWEEAEAEAGYRVYFKTKQFDMGPSDNKSLLAVISSCRKNSIPVRVLNPDEVFEEFSGIFQLPEDWIGVVTEFGGVIKPTKAVSMFQALALQRGAVLKDNSKPLETTVHYWKINEGHEGKFTIENGFPSFASYGDPYIYGTPSLEFPGLIKIPIHAGRPCEPEDRTWAAPKAQVGVLQDWIKGRFGDLVDTEKPVMTQSCMYSMTPDEDYVIDFLGGEFGEDAVVCGGFSGHGFKMGPVVGRIAAELVENGRAAGVEMRHFRIGRFEGKCKGNVKDFDDQVKKSH
ncbi:UNVERIFIED_CONTAM: putative sarcosine oxidase [Sesamum calycinum]|uniref:Sarcosine oxidase n=1 Tax=Sesamum calycinum TaxID=2727403 RepID=A0AAW2M090_9LAMI